MHYRVNYANRHCIRKEIIPVDTTLEMRLCHYRRYIRKEIKPIGNMMMKIMQTDTILEKKLCQ